MGSAPALFLDRDGVINEAPPRGEYITRWDDFRLLDGAVDGIRAARERGFRIVVVTNQRAVALGRLRREDLGAIHLRMQALLAACGAPIDAVYACTHDKDEGCACRKPGIGMLLAARDDLDIDLARSVLVSDAYQDILAARRAGLRGWALVGEPWDRGPQWEAFAGTPAFPTLREAVGHLVGEIERCAS
ncbi:MAG: HAD family hydrolase [Planctomycetes bacterium]|nr:HAD family hydrolase [Planctomycetota bacterium]